MHSRMRTSALGLAAPAVYGLTVILGGVLWPGYSHLRDPISLLESVGAPNAPLMHVLFGAYNVLLLLFGVGWRSGQLLSSRLAKLAAILLSMIGLLGLVMYFFPQDAVGTSVTPAGAVHIAIAGAMSLITMLAILFRGLAEWRDPGQRKAAVYSFSSVLLVFVTGGLAAMSIAGHWAYGGLLERLTIGGFLLWVFVEALLLLRSARLKAL